MDGKEHYPERNEAYGRLNFVNAITPCSNIESGLKLTIRCGFPVLTPPIAQWILSGRAFKIGENSHRVEV